MKVISAATLIAAFAVSAATPTQAENGRNAAAAIGFGAGAAVGAAAAGAAYNNSYYGGPGYVETAPVYDDSYAYVPSGCRTVISHHINRFGERVTVRRRVCE